ncbi:MAG: TonB-dependent receptor [Halanaerobiales bacterium]|nr:TonB-dependent receptor [Halanaerobiales bacterium]
MKTRFLVFLFMALILVNCIVDSNTFANEDLFLLDEVVVIGSNYSEILSNSVVSVEVITEEDIMRKNAENVADVLEDVAGVIINNYGDLAGLKTISIRGSNASQVLVLLDGQVLNNPQSGVVDLGQIAIEQIEKIEILRGPASIIYGANALGGVINIITKTGSEEVATSVNVNYGTSNTKKINVGLRGSTEEIKYNVSALLKNSDGDRENNDLNQINLSAKLNYILDNYLDMILSVQYNKSDFGVPGSTSWATPNARQNDKDLNINVQLNRKTEDSDLKVIVHTNKHTNTYDNPDAWGYTGPSEHVTNTIGLNGAKTDYFNDHTLSYGAKVERYYIDSTENGKHNRSETGLYVQDEWTGIDSLKVVAGCRYDYHELFGSQLTPRVGTIYTINPNMNIRFSVGKAYRTPTFNDLYWPSDGFTEGNPDLNSETAVSYEVGGRYINDSYKVELIYFNKDVKDLINWTMDNDFVYRPHNINSAKINGMEVGLTGTIVENLEAGLSYLYLKAKDADTDERLNYRPLHTVNIDFTYATNFIDFGLNGKLVSDRTNDLKDYVTLDGKISKNIVVSGYNLDIALSIINILDKEYEVLVGYPMPGRSINLEIGSKF